MVTAVRENDIVVVVVVVYSDSGGDGVVSMKCEMRYFVTVYDVGFGIRFWIP